MSGMKKSLAGVCLAALCLHPLANEAAFAQGPEPQRTTTSPRITFITSDSPNCYQPDPAQNVCYVDWEYIYVAADVNQYMIWMKIWIGGPLRAYIGGFFQSYISGYETMFPNGFRVACGAPGQGGDPELGAAYPWQIRARSSDTFESANYGTVYCPPFLQSTAGASGPGSSSKVRTFAPAPPPETEVAPPE